VMCTEKLREVTKANSLVDITNKCDTWDCGCRVLMTQEIQRGYESLYSEYINLDNKYTDIIYSLIQYLHTTQYSMPYFDMLVKHEVSIEDEIKGLMVKVYVMAAVDEQGEMTCVIMGKEQFRRCCSKLFN
jgi:hypothetical protein